MHGDAVSAYFLSANRGKRSVRPGPEVARRAPQALRRLCAEADVLVENYRPGLMDRLGLDPALLREANPALVTLSITGFGSGGPDGHRPGFDQIAQAEAGLMSITGAPDGEPTRVGLPISDLLPGMFGAFGVMAALSERDADGARPVRGHVVAGGGDGCPRLPRGRMAGRRDGAAADREPASVDRARTGRSAAPTQRS